MLCDLAVDAGWAAARAEEVTQQGAINVIALPNFQDFFSQFNAVKMCKNILPGLLPEHSQSNGVAEHCEEAAEDWALIQGRGVLAQLAHPAEVAAAAWNTRMLNDPYQQCNG